MEKTSGIKNFFRNVSGRNLKDAVGKRKALEKELISAESHLSSFKENPYIKLQREERRLTRRLSGQRRNLVRSFIPQKRALKKALKSLDEGVSDKVVIDSLKGKVPFGRNPKIPTLKEDLQKRLRLHEDATKSYMPFLKNYALKLKPIRDARIRRRKAFETNKSEASKDLIRKQKELNTMRGLEEKARKAKNRDQVIAGGIVTAAPSIAGIKMYSGRRNK